MGFGKMQCNAERILLVFGKMNRGGAETLAMNIYRNIDRSKIQFDFVVHTNERCHYDAEIEELGGKIYHFPQYNGKNHFKYKRIWDCFFKEHPEYKLIHAHMTGSASVFLPIAKKYGLYTISHSHIAKSQKGFRQMMINLYRYPLKHISDSLFSCSDIAGEWMFGKDVIKRDNYHVIKNGVDVEKFSYNTKKRDEIRKELGLEGKFVVGNVGRLHEQKNHEFLINIFCEIEKQYPDSALIIIGTGELEEQLKNQVSKLGLDGKVLFLGIRGDVDAVLSAMDVFVMPSFREGLPVSLVEAQASGVRIVASDTISSEIYLTDLIEAHSLADSAQEWAETILKYKNGYDRANSSEDIKRAGYDIQNTVSWLQEFYQLHSKEQ